MTASTFSGPPETWPRIPVQSLFSLSKNDLESLQLQWAQKRFTQLQEHIPALESFGRATRCENHRGL